MRGCLLGNLPKLSTTTRYASTGRKSSRLPDAVTCSATRPLLESIGDLRAGDRYAVGLGKDERSRCAGLCNGWYRKAAEYIQGTQIVVSFVSTNSISQGEQVGRSGIRFFQRFDLKIHFAHRTFAWESEARGKAHVHVVIIGFGVFDAS